MLCDSKYSETSLSVIEKEMQLLAICDATTMNKMAPKQPSLRLFRTFCFLTINEAKQKNHSGKRVVFCLVLGKTYLKNNISLYFNNGQSSSSMITSSLSTAALISSKYAAFKLSQ